MPKAALSAKGRNPAFGTYSCSRQNEDEVPGREVNHEAQIPSKPLANPLPKQRARKYKAQACCGAKAKRMDSEMVSAILRMVSSFSASTITRASGSVPE